MDEPTRDTFAVVKPRNRSYSTDDTKQRKVLAVLVRDRPFVVGRSPASTSRTSEVMLESGRPQLTW